MKASYGPVLSQRLKQLPTGVQWEISRLVTSGEIKISEILFDDLQTLQGSNHEMAPLVSKTFRRKKETRQPAEKEDQHWREIHEKAFGQEIAARVGHKCVIDAEPNFAHDVSSLHGQNSTKRRNTSKYRSMEH